MFGFLADAGNYDSRVVGRDDFPWGMVSTARVSDGEHPYETAVQHTGYNAGKMVIVEAYDGIEIAREGHVKWLAAMTSDVLPKELVDCSNAHLSQFLNLLGGGE